MPTQLFLMQLPNGQTFLVHDATELQAKQDLANQFSLTADKITTLRVLGKVATHIFIPDQSWR